MQVELVRKQREVDLEKLEIERREKQYDSEVKKKADADRYAVEQAAEADKVRQVRRAEARQFEIEAEAKARAEGARAEGLASAEVILQRGLAEAEAKEKLAEAFARYGEAAVLDLLATMMPALAREIAAPLASIQKLTVVDTGGGQGVGRVTDSVANLMATTPELIKSLTGVDLLALAEQFATGHAVTPTGDGAPPALAAPADDTEAA
jgi:flotillin